MFESLLRVDLLGHLRARLDDAQEIQLGPARQRAVFAVLADNCDRIVPRDELIHGVWGASPPASVDGNVHTYISGLRRVLEPERARWSGGDLLVSESPGYRLRLPPACLDLTTFRCLRERAFEHQIAGDHEGAVQQLDAALALWRGEAFGGVPGPYAEQRRNELAEDRLVLVEQRIQNLLALGEHSDLVPELEALAQEHPLRESVWESLITALHRGGRRMEALDRIAHVRGVLREHLGVEPGPAIRALHQQLLVGEPENAPEPVLRRPRSEMLWIVPEGVGQPPLVGRDLETARFRSLAAEVRGRRGRAVLVEGEAGIGKTALLAAALATVDPGCCHLIWASADEQRRSPVCDALGLGPGSSMSDVYKRVEQLCAAAPLVLIVDDLHHADDRCLLAWDQLSVATRSLPLLLIASSRSDVDSQAFARLRRGIAARDDTVIALGPLNRSASAALIQQIVGAEPGPGLRALATNSLGNPRLLRKTIASLVRDDAISASAGVVDLLDPSERALVASMTTRLDKLSDAALEVLRAAAALGMRFTTTELAAVVGRWPSELLDVVEEAVQAKVLVYVGQSLAFTHPAQRHALLAHH